MSFIMDQRCALFAAFLITLHCFSVAFGDINIYRPHQHAQMQQRCSQTP